MDSKHIRKNNDSILKYIFIVIVVAFAFTFLGLFISELIYKFNPQRVYSDLYNIDIIKPEKVKELYREGDRDFAIFEKLIYNKEDFSKALEYEYVLEMDTERVLRFVRIRLKYYLTDEGIEKIDEYIDDELLNDSNYYAIFKESDAYYILFIYNIKENSIYSFILVE
ncbi:MAG TPA: hypothetical protein IAB65_05860 [Candidatus Onthocola stercorigallinarum]|nr:hypothetical protein [Candidatus Onthocola stercorigallinarum]